VQIILATKNKGKLKEFNELATDTDIEFIEIPSQYNFPEETGNTFFENALIKARFSFSVTGKPSLGDDSGLEVDCLNGKPGVHSSRYSKEGTDESNLKKLLFELQDVKSGDRSAKFKCCLVLVLNEEQAPISFSGEMEGKISEFKKGDKGFGYDPIFIPKGSSLHMAEMEKNEKNLISHRANAFRLLIENFSLDLSKE
tara:strand:- start:18799 stop:19392 length:594 start_codon:yes stop_codon:yes gene_type:complete